MTEVFKLFRTNDRNVSAKRKTQQQHTVAAPACREALRKMYLVLVGGTRSALLGKRKSFFVSAYAAFEISPYQLQKIWCYFVKSHAKESNAFLITLRLSEHAGFCLNVTPET